MIPEEKQEDLMTMTFFLTCEGYQKIMEVSINYSQPNLNVQVKINFQMIMGVLLIY